MKKQFLKSPDSSLVLYKLAALTTHNLFRLVHKVFDLFCPLLKMIRQENETKNTYACHAWFDNVADNFSGVDRAVSLYRTTSGEEIKF